ncbi:hypothetical protein F5Y18DRAFT_369462 [Xylariaceae sp. FL1019]|nr:hypothetical protein F5Y18DRAFT_369462 [Xylariaceae sp. FL1019]
MLAALLVRVTSLMPTALTMRIELVKRTNRRCDVEQIARHEINVGEKREMIGGTGLLQPRLPFQLHLKRARAVSDARWGDHRYLMHLALRRRAWSLTFSFFLFGV